MGLSNVAVEQREKEAKALKSFLLYSSIVSLLLHICILALGISRFLQKVPETKDQPIEITIIETVPQKVVTKLQEIQKSQLKINSGGGTLGGGNNEGNRFVSAETSISVTNPSTAPVVKQRPPKNSHNFVVKQLQTRTIPEPAITPPTEKTTPIEKITPEPTTTPLLEKTTPIEKFSEKLETPATTQPTPDQTVIQNTKLSNVEAPKSTTPVSVSSNNISKTSLSGNTSSNLSSRLRNTY
ncbi:energy transducer TonB, partial [Anabaena sp. UHCC 0451]|nr:energy transducer TonB [Anabaena sp. UHCC 0451]